MVTQPLSRTVTCPDLPCDFEKIALDHRFSFCIIKYTFTIVVSKKKDFDLIIGS